jgi:hypothetical protein
MEHVGPWEEGQVLQTADWLSSSHGHAGDGFM